MLLLLCFPTFLFIQGYQQWDSNKAKHLSNVSRKSCKAEQKSLVTVEQIPVLQEWGWEGFPRQSHIWDGAVDGIRAPQSPPHSGSFPKHFPLFQLPARPVGGEAALRVETQMVPLQTIFPVLHWAFPRDQAALNPRKGRNSH